VGWIRERKLSDGRKVYLAGTRAPDRRQVTKQCRTKAEARAWIAATETDVARGQYVDPNAAKIPLTDWADHWTSTRVGVRATTAVRDASIIANHIKPAFGTRDLDQISREDVQRWLKRLSQKRSPQTVRRAYQLLRVLMDEAVAAGRLRANPIDRLALALTAAEVDKLVVEMPDQYRGLVLFLAYSGLRIGEAAYLRHRHIDRERAVVVVEGTLVEVHGSVVEQPPKTTAGRRIVPVPRAVLDAIVPGAPDEYVFTGAQGGPIRARAFLARHFRPAVERAELTPLRVHDLRATHISMLYAVGASPAQVQARLGHADARVALEHYAVALPDVEDATTRALEQLAAKRGTIASRSQASTSDRR
jgi:integrase